jgi:aspartyl-tRNA synthetase
MEEDWISWRKRPTKCGVAPTTWSQTERKSAAEVIRIHQQDIQERIINVLGISKEEAEEKFGFLLEALQYGAPPHGGIAFGIDRLIMLFSGSSSHSGLIAFPKKQKATCLMSGAPSEADIRQLLELCIKVESQQRTEPWLGGTVKSGF